MNTYKVTIRATVVKPVEVEAENIDAAIEQAHETFSVLAEEGIDEKYDQETVEIEQIRTN